MKNITRIVRNAAAAVATTAAALCTFAGASEAQAQERDQTATTGWYWLSGVDAAPVTAKINQGYRLVYI